MERIIDVSKYLPPIVRDTENFKDIAKAENPEFNVLLNTNIKDAFNNQFVEDANESGIKRYESIVKIHPKASDTLEDRNAAILLKYNQQLPYTYRTLENKLIALYGIDGFKLGLKNNEYVLNVEIFSSKWNMFDTTIDNFREIIPCNLILKATMINKVLSKLLIGGINFMGEETTVYPYTPKELESTGHFNVAAGQNVGVESVTLYPTFIPITDENKEPITTETGAILTM
ncbi:hypothetical protein CLPUN_03080 [Clostridium puniceum]|uniref:DUF2313 domain-containing protein n=1 Tax=Clostridium puniceum TaxID=29367 RepID=A0A1S8TXK8_9CLOT|nr:putative phage tail protein [Clostridium puniceum]OOM82339.1 hypothetical protein CLPUN_03080 [Clostridium puniceum]